MRLDILVSLVRLRVGKPKQPHSTASTSPLPVSCVCDVFGGGAAVRWGCLGAAAPLPEAVQARDGDVATVHPESSPLSLDSTLLGICRVMVG